MRKSLKFNNILNIITISRSKVSHLHISQNSFISTQIRYFLEVFWLRPFDHIRIGCDLCGQLGIPQCISPWAAAAAAVMESLFFTVEVFKRVTRACLRTASVPSLTARCDSLWCCRYNNQASAADTQPAITAEMSRVKTLSWEENQPDRRARN